VSSKPSQSHLILAGASLEARLSLSRLGRRSMCSPEGFRVSTTMAEPDRILRIRTVLNRTGLSRSTLYRKISDGSFPHQVKIGERSAGWRESAINQWIADPAGYREASTA